jgi:hypothetical protein
MLDQIDRWRGGRFTNRAAAITALLEHALPGATIDASGGYTMTVHLE